MSHWKPYQFFGLVILAGIVTGCAGLPASAPDQISSAYYSKNEASLSSRLAPVIISEASELPYNRVGRPAARYDDKGNEEVYIDNGIPVFYFQKRSFETPRGKYTNLIYRIHFEKVPFSLIPFHLTTGKNVGLFIIETLNEDNEPVLVTTVHTCGCYLAMVPTSFLPESAYPDNWSIDSQNVFGERLPGMLEYSGAGMDNKLVIYLRHGTHRVMGLRVLDKSVLAQHYKLIEAAMAPMESLRSLPLGDATTSFYETEGADKGYVKGSTKPLEFLLMSWWALDARVGVDKELGEADESGTVFYTSLKPWNRSRSDMWPFASFLAFWGWKL